MFNVTSETEATDVGALPVSLALEDQINHTFHLGKSIHCNGTEIKEK